MIRKEGRIMERRKRKMKTGKEGRSEQRGIKSGEKRGKKMERGIGGREINVKKWKDEEIK